MTSPYVTKDGFEKLQKELEDLKTSQLPRVIERIARAKELGDLSENAEYHDAKDEQGFLVGRINEIETLLRKASIIHEHGTKDYVSVGSTVILKCDGTQKEFTITGSNEADPVKGLISNESPLGKSFLGRKIGETFTVVIPKGQMQCEVLKIK